MIAATRSDSSQLSPATSGFVLSAAITFIFNTALAWAKDAYPPLNSFMKALTGHHWTTHGLADLLLFVLLGLIFTKLHAGEKLKPARLIAILIASVAISSLGLALWYLFV